MIPYGRHSINDDDIAAVVQALKSDWLTTGPLVEQFESELQNFVGAPCISVSSGTAALHCAYAAIGLEPGDEIITPPITFIATQATASLFGAKIVFADVDSDTGNIDPAAVAAAVTSRTKAIVAVDYAGHPAELDELKAIASRHGIYLIEDAAHSFGSKYRNRAVGSIADLTAFSFFPTKNLTTGEGGAVSSIHPELLEKARRFARQGMVRSPMDFRIKSEGPWHQEVQQFGLNYRLPDILCALGLSQLKRASVFFESRKKIVESYISILNNSERIFLPSQKKYVDPMWHLFPIQVEKQFRESIYKYLHAKGIKVQVNYLPAHLHPVFAELGYKKGQFPKSEEFYEREISLPIYHGLNEKQVEEISKALLEFFYKIDDHLLEYPK